MKELLYLNNFNHRFDFVAKILYIKYRHCVWFVELYKNHIQTFNGGWEFPGTKVNVQGFVESFDKLINSFDKYGFIENHPIPVGKNNIIENGCHRLALSYTTGIEPLIRRGNVNDDNCVPYNYNFFRNRNPTFNKSRPPILGGMKNKFLDRMALEFCINVKSFKVICLFPAAKGNDSKVDDILNKNGVIYYKKRISLSKKALINLTHELYRGESWIGGLFPTCSQKGSLCYGSDDLRVYIFSPNTDCDIVKVKGSLRKIYNIQKHSVHIHDTYDEGIRIAKTVLNDNSISFLEKKKGTLSIGNKKLLTEYISKSNDDMCIDSSFVMALYGLREAKDLDYLSIGDLKKDIGKDINCHNSCSHNYTKSKEDIVMIPDNHFYFAGVKVASLEHVRDMKIKRNEDKDKVDVKLIGLKQTKMNKTKMNQIDKIFIINLDKRTDRWDKCVEQLKTYNITNYERFSAVQPELKNIDRSLCSGFSQLNDNGVVGALGCKSSHLTILKKARDDGLNNVLILEDDFLLCKDFVNKYNNMVKDISEHKIYINMLYLGFRPLERCLETSIPNLKKVSNALTTHAYIVNKDFLDNLIKEIESSKCEIDVCYVNVQKKYSGIFGIYPCFASQRPCFSDIECRHVNYGSIIELDNNYTPIVNKFYSQYKQDQVVFNKFFSTKKEGFFLEIGADDGLRFSNCAFFEKTLGWKGIAVEARDSAYDKLIKNRDCICVNTVLSDKKEIADFQELSGYGIGLSGLVNKYCPRHKERISCEIKNPNHKGSLIKKVQTTLLSDLLEKHGVVNIDFLSIDTEGSELDILKTVDFDKYNIDVITIEDNYDDPKLLKFFQDRKYDLITSVKCDKIFRKR